MAEKMITEVQALNAVRALVVTEVAAGVDEKWNDVLNKIDHMIEVRSRKHDRKKDTSKRDANVALGEQFADTFEGETFKAADVANALGVSVAKASAICKAMGWEKVPTTEKVAVYTL